MKKSMLWICVLVSLLGFVAFVLGVAAEAKHTKAKDVKMMKGGKCIYPRSPALGMGVIAALSLMMAQMIINIAAGCLCWGTNFAYQNPFRTGIAVLCLLLSWISFVVAFVLFLAGAALNDQHNEDSFLSGKCYVIKSGVFAGGAILSLVTVSLGIAYYIISYAVKSSAAWKRENEGVSMTQPQRGTLDSQPVFVPETIYNDYHENSQFYDGFHVFEAPTAQQHVSSWT